MLIFIGSWWALAENTASEMWLLHGNHSLAKFMKVFKTQRQILRAACCYYCVSQAIRQWFIEGFHHSVMKFGRVSAWLSDWYLSCGWPQEKNYCCKLQLHQTLLRMRDDYGRLEGVLTVPCHIWRLSQPAPGQVSPPHPAQYQTLKSKHKRERKEGKIKRVSTSYRTNFWHPCHLMSCKPLQRQENLYHV